MTVHVLHAGDGYSYLSRSVASQDVQREAGQSLAGYYHANGTPPGRWMGSGVAGLAEYRGQVRAERVVSGTVTEAQMKALFGEGLHPNADAISRGVYAAATTPRALQRAGNEVLHQTKLGRKFPAFKNESRLRDTLEAADRAFADDHGRPPTTVERRELHLTAARPIFEDANGRAPQSERELSSWVATETARHHRYPVAGFDLTFTPAKSVSVLWALGDDEVRQAVEAAHRGAVADTIEWLEHNAAFTRTGDSGERQINTKGLIIAAYDHYDTRAGDPNLHTHCAVSNKVQGADGKWRSIDGTAVFKHGVAASQRYNAQVVDNLRRSLGVDTVERATGRGKQPVIEIAGIDERLCRSWSKRSDMIRQRRDELVAEYRAKHGYSPSTETEFRLLQQANLDTRTGKNEAKSLAQHRAEWRAQAAKVLGSSTRIDTMITTALRPQQRSGARVFQGVEAEAKAVIAEVSEKRATWARPHLAAAAEARLAAVEFPTPQQRRTAIDTVTDRALTRESVTLEPPETEPVPEALQRSDGASQLTRHGEQLHTSTAVLDAEARLLTACTEPTTAFTTRAQLDTAIQALDREPNEGQRALAAHFCLSGARVAVATGAAGAGKTTAMKAVADAWQASGRDVIALAPSAAAAEKLGEEVGTDASTVASLTYPWRGRIPGVPAGTLTRDIAPGTMILVDEAAMTSLHDLDALRAIATETGAVVRMLGDPAQLDAVETSGTLRLLADHTNAPELSTVVRFGKDELQARNSLLLRDGDPAAIDMFDQRGWLHGGDRDTLTENVVQAHLADTARGRSSIVMTDTVAVTKQLNERIQDHHRGTGRADATTTVTLADELDAGRGDQIVTRDNNKNLRAKGGTRPGSRVMNGDLWTVEQVHSDGSLTVRHADHRGSVRLPAEYVQQSVELGYASTVHRAQGLTVDAGHYLTTPGSAPRQSAYVGLTRGRAHNIAYVITDQPLDLATEGQHIHHAPDTERDLQQRHAWGYTTSDDVSPAVAGMRRILATDASELSATEQLRTALAEADSPETARRGYDAARVILRDAYLDHLIDRSLPSTVVATMREDDPTGYLQLRATLATIHDARQHPERVLTDAVNQRELLTAAQPAAVLTHRITTLTGSDRTTPEDGLAPLPPRHPGADIALAEYAAVLSDRYDTLHAHTTISQDDRAVRDSLLTHRERLYTDGELAAFLARPIDADPTALPRSNPSGIEQAARAAAQRYDSLVRLDQQWEAFHHATQRVTPAAAHRDALRHELAQAQQQRSQMGRLSRGRAELDARIEQLRNKYTTAHNAAKQLEQDTARMRPAQPRPHRDDLVQAQRDRDYTAHKANRSAPSAQRHQHWKNQQQQRKQALRREQQRRDSLAPEQRVHEQQIRDELRRTQGQFPASGAGVNPEHIRHLGREF
ncbi:relaxase domain-containing protein [Hoyosella sp. YIM 151337]|uniref:MobF family relaxase n=1 Tax=Hoyosella sp. YIM 151337 TaxID=2992742 RepID=UPI00223562CA|nr:MobF family relaxase [Hoyosella sp. YIM 151337]MCW4353419.1 relaxase domain-containing protein [Hoyosella sp. YIM 151337]